MFAALACRASIDEMTEVYYSGPGRRVLCSTAIDSNKADMASILRGLQRASRDGTILQLYAHDPRSTITPARIEGILKAARDLGLATFTYRQLAEGIPASPGIALSFDDWSIDGWYDLAELFERYDAHVTFFVARYRGAKPERRGKLQELYRRGHDVEAHSMDHAHAPIDTPANVERYVAEQVEPSLAVLREDGFTPRVYAYPFGEHFDALDRAVLEHVDVVRTTAYAIDRSSDGCR